MKIIICPHCGKVAGAIGIGRTPTNITVTDICDTLQLHRSVPAAAKYLQCSRALIYKVLKQHGMTPVDVIKEHATKDTSLLHNGELNDKR